MALRTHHIFAVLANERRLQVLLAVLDRDGASTGELARELRIAQTGVSQSLTALSREGLVHRGNQRTPYRVTRPRETRLLLRAAALIEFEERRDPAALAMADRLRRQDMTSGATEPRPADEDANDGG